MSRPAPQRFRKTGSPVGSYRSSGWAFKDHLLDPAQFVGRALQNGCLRSTVSHVAWRFFEAVQDNVDSSDLPGAFFNSFCDCLMQLSTRCDLG